MPPLLDSDRLVAPIAKPPLTGDIEDALFVFLAEADDLRKSLKDASEKRPGWTTLLGKGEQFLENQAKHLQVAGYITLALTKLHGLGGATAGLDLLARLAAERGADLLPKAEASRLRIFKELDNPDAGYRFPLELELLPLAHGNLGSYDLHRFTGAVSDFTDDQKEDMSQAVANLTADDCRRLLAEEVKPAQAALERLRAALPTLFPKDPPTFHNTGQVLGRWEKVLDKLLAEKCPPAGASPDREGEGGAASSPSGDGALAGGRAVAGTATTWNGLLHQLEDVTAAMERLRGPGPATLLLRRAIALGRLSFADQMRRLIRDPNVLAELFRDLDVATEPPAEPST